MNLEWEYRKEQKLFDFGFIKSIYFEFKQATYGINWEIIPFHIQNSIVNQSNSFYKIERIFKYSIIENETWILLVIILMPFKVGLKKELEVIDKYQHICWKLKRK